MMEREVMKRRDVETLESLKVANNKVKYELVEQTDFKGSPELLERMQSMERAYMDGYPVISDEEWEILKNKWNYKESLIAKAPSGRNWIKLSSPLPSIDKVGTIEDLREWLKLHPQKKWLVEPKLDGLTANLIFNFELDESGQEYRLKYITSRGNGFYGMELHPYALYGVKTNIMYHVSTDAVAKIYAKYDDELHCGSELPNTLELRGEAVIPKTVETEQKYGKDAVLRSVASGMFTRKVPSNIPGLLQMHFGFKTYEEFLAWKLNHKDHITNIYGLYAICMHEMNELTNADLRLYASLNDPEGKTAFNKRYGDKMFAIIRQNADRMVSATILIQYGERNANLLGMKSEEFSCDEWLDIVFYSMSVGDNNISAYEMKELIPHLKHISDIDYYYGLKEAKENGDLKGEIPEKLSRITSDPEEIVKAVCEFYGCDLDGKRNKNLPRMRNLYEYALDGVVIKPVGSNRKTQGLYIRNGRNNPSKVVSPKYPDDQIAVKLRSEMVRVKLDHIEYKETTLGNKTCTGVLDKPYMTESGSVVERINLHNVSWLQSNSWIKEGQEYWMVMAMDIIPQLVDPKLLE